MHSGVNTKLCLGIHHEPQSLTNIRFEPKTAEKPSADCDRAVGVIDPLAAASGFVRSIAISSIHRSPLVAHRSAALGVALAAPLFASTASGLAVDTTLTCPGLIPGAREQLV